MPEQTQAEKKSLRLEILDKMSSLATSGFGLVAALAWNDAIQRLFDSFFPQESEDTHSVIAKFLYAILITLIVVLVTTKLGSMTNTLKQALDKKKT
jgi:hypothetical protein